MAVLSTGASGLIDRGFRWWQAGLRAALPTRVTRVALGDDRLVVLWFENDQIAADQIHAGLIDRFGRAAPVARVIPAGLPRVLVPPQGLVLHRQVTLPAATADRLDQAVAINLERWTAFRPEDVHYLARIIAPTAGGDIGDRIDIDLYLIPKPALAGALAASAVAGHPATHIRLGPMISDHVALDLVADRRQTQRRLIDRCLILLLPVTLLFTLSTCMAEVTRTHQALRAEIAAGVREQRRLAERAAELAAIEQPLMAQADDSAGRLPISALLAELGRRLPLPGGIIRLDWDGRSGVLVLDPGAPGPMAEAGDLLELQPDGPDRWSLRLRNDQP